MVTIVMLKEETYQHLQHVLTEGNCDDAIFK